MAQQIIADFHNRRRGIRYRTKKLQTHGTRVFRHGVQHKGHAGDDAVCALFLHPWHARQEFIGHVFAQADFAEFVARDAQAFGRHDGFAIVF